MRQLNKIAFLWIVMLFSFSLSGCGSDSVFEDITVAAVVLDSCNKAKVGSCGGKFGFVCEGEQIRDTPNGPIQIMSKSVCTTVYKGTWNPYVPR